MRVLLAGGGSGGSATPLLAVAEELRAVDPRVDLLYIGTYGGPEAHLARAQGLLYASVQAGKFRRYANLANLTDPIRVLMGIAQSLRLVHSFAPHAALGAGGFGCVPPLVACWLAGVPFLIHQQDVEPGLANRLLAPMATAISVSLPCLNSSFSSGKTRVNGNPVRPSILRGDAGRARERFGLQPDRSVLLAMGGGTGAASLNRLMAAASAQLVAFCQVIHLTGPGRQDADPVRPNGYRAYEFLVDEMADALAVADLVVCRAGFSTLTELAALGKPALLVPMPNSHQRANAAFFGEIGAAMILEEHELDPPRLVEVVRSLLEDANRRRAMSLKALQALPRDAAARVAEQLRELCSER